MQQRVPEYLKEKLTGQYGRELTERILTGYENEKPVTLRVNTLKTDRETVRKCLELEGIRYKEVLWNQDAFMIEGVREAAIEGLEIYKTGKIYLQSLSSMLPPLVLAPKAGESILDMAAAPGGKTTQMAAISGNMASITACEKNKIRAERLQYNLERQGASRVCVMVSDARRLDDFFSFDKVLLDAPCTGSGTLDMCRREAKDCMTRDSLSRSARLQEELLVKALKLLKPGHEMVYSTCSILMEENEQVVERALKKVKAQIEPVGRDGYQGIPMLPVKLEGTMCVCPDRWYEGFFVAKLKKKS